MDSSLQPRADGGTLRLPERYEVRRHIATGGMASVWCAEDLVLGRAVAVKVLAERFMRDEVAVRRFKREARAAARVSSHAHVVTIYDVGDALPGEGPDATGRAFIVMEYLAGGTVADAIRVGAVKRREALRWLREAASALDHAHGRGIVHRDIKPANFLLDGHRILHVADFGIARLVSEDTITSSGELFGTAAYLAPEQALGHEATGASDRYALTVAAFELLAGERPFTAAHFAAQARQHIDDPPPSASERDRTLPTAIDPVLMRGMAKEPGARYETAGAMVDALDQALAAPPTSTTRTLAGVRAASAGRSATRPVPGAAAQRARLPAAGSRPGAAIASFATPATAADRVDDRRRRGRAVALAALTVAVLGVGGLALAGIGSSGRNPSSAQRSPRAAAPVAHRAQPARHPASVASSTSSSTTTAPATGSSSKTTAAAGQSAEQLQQTGHQALLSGDYQTAIPTLRQAVSAASPQSLTYAYALYDLGRSLTLSGDPNGAIPVLQQRLKIHNQTPVVQQALDQALRAAGRSSAYTAPSTTGPTAQPAPQTPQSPTPAPASTGGAGLGSAGHGGHGHQHGHGGGNGD